MRSHKNRCSRSRGCFAVAAGRFPRCCRSCCRRCSQPRPLPRPGPASRVSSSASLLLPKREPGCMHCYGAASPATGDRRHFRSVRTGPPPDCRAGPRMPCRAIIAQPQGVRTHGKTTCFRVSAAVAFFGGASQLAHLQRSRLMIIMASDARRLHLVAGVCAAVTGPAIADAGDHQVA